MRALQTLLTLATPCTVAYYFGVLDFHDQTIRIKWKERIVAEIKASEITGEKCFGFLKTVVKLYLCVAISIAVCRKIATHKRKDNDKPRRYVAPVQAFVFIVASYTVATLLGFEKNNWE